MPNASGGKGVPKYVKQLEGTAESENGTYFNGDWCETNGTANTDEKSNSLEGSTGSNNVAIRDSASLSASATEFKPKSLYVPLGNGKVSYAAAAAKLTTA